MNLHQPNASLFVPDGRPVADALGRTTHLGVGAHQDDLEFMALHGILAGYRRADRWFGGITVTNGGGSARNGAYVSYSDEEMMEVRREEQRNAARIGQYSFMAQLDYPSAAVKAPKQTDVREDLSALFRAARPDVVYTHNPADKHATHVAVFAAVIESLRALPAAERPERVLGCEVWRDLDWLPDDAKTVLDVSGHESLADALNGVFDSQIAGGKRYDLAVLGRRRANATFLESHATDDLDQAWFAMDLTPLVRNNTLDPAEYVQGFIDRFAADVRDKLAPFQSQTPES